MDIHREINQVYCSSYINIIIYLFKLWFLLFLNVIKDYIWKFLKYFVLLKEAPAEILMSVYQMLIFLSYNILFIKNLKNFKISFLIISLKISKNKILNDCIIIEKRKVRVLSESFLFITYMI